MILNVINKLCAFLFVVTLLSEEHDELKEARQTGDVLDNPKRELVQIY